MALTITPGPKSLDLYFTVPTGKIYIDDDTNSPLSTQVEELVQRDDLVNLKVWASTTSNFTPDAGTLKYDATFQSKLTLTDLLANTTYYVKYAYISKIDPDSYTISAQSSATTESAVSLLTLDPTDWAFIFDNNLATTANYPASITFTANKQNITGAVTFTATAYNSSNTSLGSVTLTGTGDVRTLSAANFNSLGTTTVRYVKVVATLGTLSDTVTIWRGDNGSDALTFLLTNESHTVPADSSGNVTSYTGAVTYAAIFRGITNETSLWTITKSDGTGLTTTLTGTGTSNITLTVNTLASGTDSAVSTLTATRTGYPTLTKDFSISKSKAGTNGTNGAPGATGPTGPQGTAGAPGATGLEGIRTITAYRLRSQSDVLLTTAPSNTSGATAPTDYSLTAPTATVGQVVWYTFGRYNPNATTVDSIPANTTVWSVPIAASVFQDIKSDNWTGGTPSGGTFTSSTGYYLNRTEGSLYATSAYLRGSLVTGSSGAQRVEINLASSNRVKAFNSSNYEIATFGGIGDNSESIISTAKTGTFVDYSYNQTIYYPRYIDSTPVGAGWFTATAQYIRTWDFSTVVQLGRWWKTNTASSNYAYAGYFGQGDPTQTANNYTSSVANIAFWDGATGNIFSNFYSYNSAGTLNTNVELARSTGVALNIITGSFKYGSVTISTPPNNTTTYLRGDGTFATLLTDVGSNYIKNLSVATNTLQLGWDGNYLTLRVDSSDFGGSANTSFPVRLDAGRITTGTISTGRLGSGTASSAYFLRGDSTWSNNIAGNFSVTGDITATGNVTAYSSSDLKLKENINRINNPLDKLLQLGGYTFDWKDEYLANTQHNEYPQLIKKHDIGIIAQEVLYTVPQAVTTRADGTLAVAYEKLIPLIIEAIKELAGRVK